MLGKFMLAGMLLAFKPRSVAPPQILDLEVISIGGGEAAPSVADALPSVPTVSREKAVQQFLGQMMEAAAGGALRFSRVAHSYRVLAGGMGWPPISDKVLSQMLVDLGCTRRTVDLRSRGDGRPTFLEFPLAQEAA